MAAAGRDGAAPSSGATDSKKAGVSACSGSTFAA